MKNLIKNILYTRKNTTNEKTPLHANFEQQVVDTIIHGEVFDESFYTSSVETTLPYANAVEHYVAVGHDLYLDPSPYFSTKFYLASNPDVKDAGVNSLYHYLVHGEGEGRKPNPLFSPTCYLELNPDLTAWPKSLLAHFSQFGFYENRSARTVVNHLPVEAAEVIDQTPKEDEKSPLNFDAEYYLANNPDVRNAGADPWGHYATNGEAEGRMPNVDFDPAFYRRVNADVRVHNISAFEHFSTSGFYEGRLGKDPEKEVRSSAVKPILFVGHDGVQAGSEIVLLEVIKWFYQHTSRQLKVLLLAPGPVANDYAKYAEVYVLSNNEVDEPEVFSNFVKGDFEFIYMNTVVSGKLFGLLKQNDLRLSGDIVTHIHEMEKVLQEWDEEMGYILEHTDTFISASPASSVTLKQKYQISEEKVTTVAAFINPVAQEELPSTELRRKARESFGIAEDAFVVAGCGTVYWRKGTDIFVETARKLRELTDQQFEFVWIGDGPDREELEGKLTEEEQGFIKFIGSHNNANELSAMADVFFLSSREDPFPLVVLESAQHGIPAICFDEATGITEFVKHNSGTILDSISEVQAAEAALAYLNDSELLANQGLAAKQQLFTKYTSTIQNQKIFQTIYEKTNYQPALSVVVPFYNHEKYLNERIDCILNQTSQDWEILTLDDCSTDNSVEVIQEYDAEYRLKVILNDENSGSPFKQWEKGTSLAAGEFIWIAEGDDTADLSFIKTLFTEFNDPMVNIVSARTEITNGDGVVNEGALLPYLEQAYPGKFSASYKRDGFAEVNEQLGSMCTLVNASGLLLRKNAISQTALDQARSFKMAGDWLLYLDCLKHGKIAHVVETANYFRRHSASQVHKVEGTEVYFNERKKILEFVLDNFSVSKKMLKRATSIIESEWKRFEHKHPGKVMSDVIDLEVLEQHENVIKSTPHIGLYVHGMTFSKGGIERLAAQLTNHLVEIGMKVTIYCRKSKHKQSIYPIYDNINISPIFDENDYGTSIPSLKKALLDDQIDVFIPMLSEWLFEPIVEAAQETGIPIIASEHNDPWKIEELWWDHDKRVECFSKVDTIHLLLNKFIDSLPEKFHDKIAVIPNGVEIPENVDNSQRENIIIAVGRLAPQKRFDRLITAVSLIQDDLRVKEFSVEIYGEGQLRKQLQQQIDDEGVSDLVSLKGNVSDLDKVYRRAKVFVMPSEFEGFGIALVEAMSYGIPSIAFEECNGPNEIIPEQGSGFLVSSVDELATKMLKITEIKSSEMSSNNKFTINRFYQHWEGLLKEYV